MNVPRCARNPRRLRHAATVGLLVPTVLAGLTMMPSPAASAAVSGAAGLDRALARWADSRGDTLSVGVYDEVGHRWYGYRMSATYDDASTVKVNILETLLWQAQARGRGLTPGERALAGSMIRVSDNAATNVLWGLVGGEAGVLGYDLRLGLTHTTFHRGAWGLTRSDVVDHIRLIRALRDPAGLLGAPYRLYALSLMGQVSSGQDWGVSAGPQPNSRVELKNGWLPLPVHGWRVNSIGHVSGYGRSYSIALLSMDNPTMGYGIQTLEGASRLIWSALYPTPRPTPRPAPKPRPVPRPTPVSTPSSPAPSPLPSPSTAGPTAAASSTATPSTDPSGPTSSSAPTAPPGTTDPTPASSADPAPSG
ncbi:MAG: class A beta-lactamase-related serine hydrolase [Actinomycetota bacterium]|nr:class A beta-lactamase-related serine hydrolase [Actinomycetota bacterium]